MSLLFMTVLINPYKTEQFILLLCGEDESETSMSSQIYASILVLLYCQEDMGFLVMAYLWEV